MEMVVEKERREGRRRETDEVTFACWAGVSLTESRRANERPVNYQP